MSCLHACFLAFHTWHFYLSLLKVDLWITHRTLILISGWLSSAVCIFFLLNQRAYATKAFFYCSLLSFSDQIPSVLEQSGQPQTFPNNMQLFLLLPAGLCSQLGRCQLYWWNMIGMYFVEMGEQYCVLLMGPAQYGHLICLKSTITAGTLATWGQI